MEKVVVISGKRTAFGSFGGSFKDISATDLGVASAKATLEAAGVAAAKAPALAALAEKGAPTPAALAAEFAPVASRLAQTKPAADAGFIDRLIANAERVVRIRPAGDVAGATPDAILARVEAKLKRGEVIAAAADWRQLPANLRAEAGPFAQRLEARADAEDAALKIQRDALGPVTQ